LYRLVTNGRDLAHDADPVRKELRREEEEDPQGRTAGEAAFPPDPSHLEGAKVVLSWDLQLK